MRVIIPAGGRGTRLGPLTLKQPKPLLPIGDQPILSRIVEGIPAGIPVTVLVTPELEGAFRAWCQNLSGSRQVSLYVEAPAGMGPRGPVSAIAEYLRVAGEVDDLTILMGDSLLPFPLAEFLALTTPGVLRLAAYQVSSRVEAKRFGVLETGADGVVRHFAEKPLEPRSTQVFTGCFYLPARLTSVFDQQCAANLPQMGHFIERCLELGERIEVFEARGEWQDIGTFESYLAAHRVLLPTSERKRLIASGNLLEGVVYVHPSAVVENSHLSNCIVGAGAMVTNARLSSCVVQTGASIDGMDVSGVLVEGGSAVPVPLIGRLN